MTDNEALALLARLSQFTPGEWDDLRIEAWVDKITRECSDDAALRDAVELVIETWTGFGAPTWQALREAYESVLRRNRLAVKALPSPRGISRAEYLQGLRVRADAGDHEAAEELAVWSRVKQTPVVSAFPVDSPRPVS